MESQFRLGHCPARVYVIAEAGLAHLGSEDLAMLMIEQAKDAGADAVKFQAFSADKLYPPGEWRDRVKKRQLGREVFPRLKAKAISCGIDLLVTPHDDYGLMVVQSLDLPAIKVGSGEKGNLPFIERIMDLGKPLIISTGMYNGDDLCDLCETVADHPYALLHCVSSYPVKDPNLARLWALTEYADVIGYSDHTRSADCVLMAVAGGARIVEFHFHPGVTVEDSNDGKASFSPDEMAELVPKIRFTESLLGGGSLSPREEEKATEKWALKNPETNMRDAHPT